jgi:hypothetical protein
MREMKDWFLDYDVIEVICVNRVENGAAWFAEAQSVEQKKIQIQIANTKTLPNPTRTWSVFFCWPPFPAHDG